MTERIYNFSAGPAVLPLEVLESVRDNLLNFKNSGLGIMEISHRGELFEGVMDSAVQTLRELLDISSDYEVIFTTGGATMQFSMIPLNLLSPEKTANFIITGHWSEKAYAEANKFGSVHTAGTSKDKNFSYIPASFTLSDNPAYLHFTSNNTIFGTQFTSEPVVSGNIPLICDASSDFLHKKIDIKKYALIYAGAQKNVGPAGVTVVILRKDLLPTTLRKNLPILLNYTTYTENNSLYNTPPVFPIYVVSEVLQWIKHQGGLAAIEANNRKKAALLYQALDSSADFFTATAEKASRSLMNVTFRLRKQELEPVFVKEAERAGLSGLKGHKAVGGIRASIYNAFPLAGVEALLSFMQDFAARHGQ